MGISADPQPPAAIIGGVGLAIVETPENHVIRLRTRNFRIFADPTS